MIVLFLVLSNFLIYCLSDKHKLIKSDNLSGSSPSSAHHQLMAASSRLDSRSSGLTDPLKTSNSSSVKPEPLDQMALYSSHFAKAPPPTASVTPHSASVLSGMSQHAHEAVSAASSSMLTGLPHLTPAPFNTHSMHQGFSLDDMTYHNTHQIHAAHHPTSHHQYHPDYSSFAASAASLGASSMTSGHLGSFSSYPGLASASEHSNHHHHAKLNLQTT